MRMVIKVAVLALVCAGVVFFYWKVGQAGDDSGQEARRSGGGVFAMVKRSRWDFGDKGRYRLSLRSSDSGGTGRNM